MIKTFNKQYNHQVSGNFDQKLNEILVKIEILQETTFFHDRVSNRKTGKTASAEFIHEVLSNLVQVLQRNDLKQADGQTKGRLYMHPSGSIMMKKQHHVQLHLFPLFYASASIGRGHIDLPVSVCLYVCLLNT